MLARLVWMALAAGLGTAGAQQVPAQQIRAKEAAQQVPAQQVPAQAGYVLRDGTVRIIGSAEMEGPVRRLDALFEQRHPGVHVRFEPADNLGAMDSLIFDATLVAPVSAVYGGGIAYSDIVKATPFAVRIAHGSMEAGARVSPYVVIVNPASPVQALSMDQLASIFSKPLRAPVFSLWRQVGVGGAAGAEAIEPAGLPWSDHYRAEDRGFGDEVFVRHFAGAAPVDDYRMFDTFAEVTAFVAREPAAIGIVPANRVTAGVRAIGLMEGASSKVRTASAAEVRAGHYPLDRFLYLYARLVRGKPMDPLALEYLQLALSPEGQAAIAAAGEGYLPLNATELANEFAKFE